MAASGSSKVVIVALGANALIAAAKFSAAAWTGSAAMLSEAIHSLADTANQGLLLHGARRSARAADARHPFGYAKELYFWAFVVAVLLFSLGSGVAIYEGVHKLRAPEPVVDPWVNYAVLGFAFVCELASTIVAVREFNRQRGDKDAVRALRGSKDPALYTVLLEDIAAVAGLLVAFAGLAAAHLLGWSHGDALASIVIGLILGLVAAFMAIETKGLLIGEAASAGVVAGIESIIRQQIGPNGRIERLHHLKTMHLGPNAVLVAASLDFRDDQSAGELQQTIAQLDARIRKRFPQVQHLYLEAQPAADAADSVARVDANIHATTAPPSSPPSSLLAPPLARATTVATAKGNYPPTRSTKGKKRRR